MSRTSRLVASGIVIVVAGFGWLAHAQGRKDGKPAPAKKAPVVRPSETPRPPQPQEKRAAGRAASPDAEQAIRSGAEAFVEAYNAHAAKAVAALFAENAEIVEADGGITKGRDAIEKSFAELFEKHPEASVEVEVESIRTLAPGVAIEEGVVHGMPDPGQPAESSRYLAVHVRTDGKWKVASVRDFESAQRSPRHERLAKLAWMVGEWVEESPESLTHTTCRFTDDGNFLIHEFVVQIAGQAAMQGTVRIGWDALAGQFRSWAFDSEGGFAEGLWVENGDEWIVSSRGVTNEGQAACATNVYRFVDDNTMGWRSYDRMLGGERIDDVPEIVVKRKPPAPAEPLGAR